MKRFRFTLHALQTLRQRQENLALERYGAALLQRQRALEGLQRIEEDLARAWTELRGELTAGCCAGEARRFQSVCSAVEAQRVVAQETLRSAESHVQRTFQLMLAARRQREQVDTLEDHQRQEYEREIARAETKLLDELALRRLPSALSWRTRN